MVCVLEFLDFETRNVYEVPIVLCLVGRPARWVPVVFVLFAAAFVKTAYSTGPVIWCSLMKRGRIWVIKA